MINETVPVYLLGSYGTVLQTCAAVGFMFCFGLGLGLPQSDYDPEMPNEAALEADKADEFWRILYGFPILINLFMLISFYINIKQDSIMYNLSIGADQEAMSIIDKLYLPSESRMAIIDNLREQCHMKQKSESDVLKALFGKRNWNATYVALIFSSLA